MLTVVNGNQIRTSQMIWHLLESQIPDNATLYLQRRADIGSKENITRMARLILFVTKPVMAKVLVIQIHMTTKSNGWVRITIRNGAK